MVSRRLKPSDTLTKQQQPGKGFDGLEPS